MSGWYLLAAIPVFGLLVLGHEFGHFITAKWAGIRVEEFGIGFPPRMFGIKRGETIYSINWLPIGGFVRMPGENGEMTDESGTYDPHSFAAKPASKRAIVLLAGVTMNIIIAFLLFGAAEISASVSGVPAAVIGTVEANSPAAAAGLESGDKLVSVNGTPVTYWSDVTGVLAPIENSLPANATTFSVTVVYYAPGASTPTTQTIQARAHPGANQGAIGITAGTALAYPPVTQAPGQALNDMARVTTLTVGGIGQIISGQLPWNKAVSGPVGIVKVTGQAASEVPQVGFYPIFFLTAYLSMSLAFVNILPIPALDGGRLLFVVIEVLRRGKRLSAEREMAINAIGMVLLLTLMVIVTFNDVSSLFH